MFDEKRIGVTFRSNPHLHFSRSAQEHRRLPGLSISSLPPTTAKQREIEGERTGTGTLFTLSQCLPTSLKARGRRTCSTRFSGLSLKPRRSTSCPWRAENASHRTAGRGGRGRGGRRERGCEMAAAGLGVKAAPFTYAAHALAAAAAVLVLVWCVHFRGGLALEAQNKNLIFNVHPVLMLIGYIILGSEAIMIYKVFPKLNHDTAKLTHLILHAIATVLGAFGIYCAFKFHNDSGIANLYSLHSWLGIGTISLYGIQWVFGFVTFFFPGAAPSVRRSALPWHPLFGLFVYVLALATAELGFLEKLTFLESGGLDKYGTEAFLVNFTALVVVLFGASVVAAAVAPAHDEAPQDYQSIPVN